jgi:hypothetical protein
MFQGLAPRAAVPQRRIPGHRLRHRGGIAVDVRRAQEETGFSLAIASKELVTISEHDHRAEGDAGPREHLPALDGLRFVAAVLVAGGHCISYFGDGTLSGAVVSLTGLGMTLPRAPRPAKSPRRREA